MKLTLAASLAALLCLVLAFANTENADVRHSLLSPATSPVGGPLGVDIVDAGGSRIEYTLTPKVDLASMSVAFDLPAGAELVEHLAPDAGAAPSGQPRIGSARLRFASSMAIGQVTLVAQVQPAGATTPQSVRSTMLFGAVDDDAPIQTAGFGSMDLQVAKN